MSRQFACEECGRGFALADGGACAGCGRSLCGRHLRGWHPRVLELLTGGRPRCRACRRAGRPAEHRPSTPA